MPTSKPDDQNTNADFVCDCEEDFRSACEGFGFFKEKDGKRYCVLHYPDKDKSEEFEETRKRKLAAKDFNFRGVWFPKGVSFESFKFTDVADFNSATFCAYADFSSVTFSVGADFTSTTFSTLANFKSANFSAATYFISATFSDFVDFSSVTFSADVYIAATTFDNTVDFSNAIFEKKAFVVFYNTRFKDKVLFKANTIAATFPLELDGAIFEKPERVTFHTLILRPRWFVNVDSRKFNFINVGWRNRKKDIKDELIALKKYGISNPHRLLEIANRHLAANAEENNRYGDAAHFRYMAMMTHSLEIRRRGYMSLLLAHRFVKERRSFHFWKRLWKWKRFFDPFHSLYGFASGWGEIVRRAFLVLILIWILFAGIYWWRSDASWWQKPKTEQSQTAPAPQALSFTEAMVYSAGVMLFQKPEPLPANKRAKFLVYLETVLGPLQAALLALAIRRKFMR